MYTHVPTTQELVAKGYSTRAASKIQATMRYRLTHGLPLGRLQEFKKDGTVRKDVKKAQRAARASVRMF